MSPMREGRGLVAPAPISVHIPRYERAIYWREAKKRARYRQYGGSQWQRGQHKDPSTTIFIGFLGEIAFSHWLYEALGWVYPVDTGLRPMGDNADFMTPAGNIEVKTCQASNVLCYARADRLAKGADYIVFVRYDRRCALASIVGWLHVAVFQERALLRPSSFGFPWSNYEIASEGLNAMSDLAILLQSKRPLC